jgi:hypothetical protein
LEFILLSEENDYSDLSFGAAVREHGESFSNLNWAAGHGLPACSVVRSRTQRWASTVLRTVSSPPRVTPESARIVATTNDDKRIVNCFGEARESRSLGPRRQGIDRDRLLDEGRRNNKAPYLRQPPRAGRVGFRRCPDRAAADRRMPRAPARLSADDVVARRHFCAIFLFACLVISVPWAAPRWH